MPAPLTITTQPLTSLKPYERNARTHSKAQIQQIADSITAFGFTNPVLVDQDNRIMAGHGRVEALKLLGRTEVATIHLDHMTPAQIKAYVIADNRIAEKAGWDKEVLAVEFQEIMKLDLDLKLEVTGFEMPQIDLMIQDSLDADPDAGDEVPEPPATPVTQLGDLWQLGQHRILCGDSLKPDSYSCLLGDEKAQIIFTDPPYNVKIQGHVSGLGRVQHEEFIMASGEMSKAQFTTFLADVFTLLVTHSVPGSIHYVCMDWRHLQEILTAGETAYAELKNICVWAKDNGGMGAFYRSRYELVLVFKNGTDPHINNVQLGKHGRYRTNVWNYRAPRRIGLRTQSQGGEDALAMHPTVKPVRMVADALMDSSHRDGLVLDPFGGSGSTLIAAENTARRARLLELEPKYVDVTIARWQKLSGQQAVLVDTGQTFAEVKAAREVCHG